MEPGKSTTILEGREKRSKEQGGPQLLSFVSLHTVGPTDNDSAIYIPNRYFSYIVFGRKPAILSDESNG